MACVERSRNIALILYPEDKTHVMALRILQASSLQWCAILHDKDYESGELKKAHYHVLVRFSSPQSLVGFASRLGVAVNYLQCCSNAVAYMQYLCHCNDLDKFQYPDTAIFGSCAGQARTYVLTARNSAFVPKLSQSEAFGAILDFIQSWDGFLSYSTLCAWAVSSNLYGYFRQSFSVVRALVSEHNWQFERSLYNQLQGESSTDFFKSYIVGHADGVACEKNKNKAFVEKWRDL